FVRWRGSVSGRLVAAARCGISVNARVVCIPGVASIVGVVWSVRPVAERVVPRAESVKRIIERVTIRPRRLSERVTARRTKLYGVDGCPRRLGTGHLRADGCRTVARLRRQSRELAANNHYGRNRPRTPSFLHLDTRWIAIFRILQTRQARRPKSM